MDYSQLQMELIAAMRSGRSQAQLSRRLGYKHNQLNKWETAARGVSWANFVKLAVACRCEIKAALHLGIGYSGPLASTAELTRHLVGSGKLSEIARTTGYSRYQLGRWLKSQAKPDLKDILTLMDRANLHLTDFVEKLVDISVVPSLRDHHTKSDRQRSLAAMNPHTAAVTLATEVESYRRLPTHSDAVMAQLTGLSPAEVAKILASATKHGVLERIGDKYRLPPGGERVDLFDSIPETISHWSQHSQAVRRHRPYRRGEQAAYRVASVSTEARDKIAECCADFYKAVRNICGSDAAAVKEHILVFTMQCIDPSLD